VNVLVVVFASAAAILAVIALVVWLATRRGARLGTPGILQRSRLSCSRCGQEFDYDWFPGASLTALRLGRGRYMACPCCHRWSYFDLYGTMVARPGPGERNP
jgi:DNA-directed RNA polymerase subunit RPC12/RpoP